MTAVAVRIVLDIGVILRGVHAPRDLEPIIADPRSPRLTVPRDALQAYPSPLPTRASIHA